MRVHIGPLKTELEIEIGAQCAGRHGAVACLVPVARELAPGSAVCAQG